MERANYIQFVKSTIGGYSNKINKYLYRNFIDMGIVNKDSASKLDLEGLSPVDVSMYGTISEKVQACVENNLKALREFERWEFIKDFKYSVVYLCDNFDDTVKKIQNIADYNIFENGEHEYMFDTFKKPIRFELEKYIFLKFNLKFAAIHPSTGEELVVKYPFLVVFHKDTKIVEFRFDTLERFFLGDSNDSRTYSLKISLMEKFLLDEYGCILSAMDLNFLITVTKSDPKVQLISQYMKLSNGGNAQLEVGNNEEYVLPFIDELKNIIRDFNEDLSKIPGLQDALQQFMFEIEEMSDYPWIELLWDNEVKTRKIRVKFVFNYMNNAYCLMQHYYSDALIGMERMNHVIDYIVKNRENSTK